MNEWMGPVRAALDIPQVQALLLVVGSIVVARLVDVVVTRILRRLVDKTTTDLDDRLIEHLHRPVFATVVLLGLYFAVPMLGLPDGASWWLTRLVQTLIVVIWFVGGLRLCSVVLEALGRAADRIQWIESRTVPLFDNLAKIVIFGAALYCLLVVWNLDVAPWLASAGIAGIAIGFAAKDTLANLFGGLFVIADSPYKIGDYINLGTGERGEVSQIGLRSTRILTRDDVEVTIPNAQIANSTIVNESGGRWVKSRVTVRVGVAYGSDIEHVRRLLLQAAHSVDFVLTDPEPRIRFTEMGDSALIFRVLCWIDRPELRGSCVDGLNTAIYELLNAENVTIPFPQRDVHIHQAPPASRA